MSINRRVRITRVALAGVLVLSTSSCGRESPDIPDAVYSSPGTMVISMSSDRAAALRPFAEKFGRDNGLTVHLESIGDVRDRRSDLLYAQRPPDIVVGEHHWVGELVAAGVIDPVPLSGRQKAAFDPLAARAVTYAGRSYGVPLSILNAVLYRDLALVPRAPATMEELLAAAGALKASGRARESIRLPVGERGNLAYLYPLYASAGGYLFGTRSDGTPDPADLGVGTPESIAAFARIGALGENGAGALSRKIDEGKVGSGFVNGDAPFLVAYPVVAELIDGIAKRTYAVSPVPGFAGGKPAPPLLSVQTFYLSSKATNKVLARKFLLEVATTVEVQLALNEGEHTPPALTAAVAPAVAASPELKTIVEIARTGVPSPNIPEMAHVWQPFGQAVADVVGGANPADAVRTAEKAIRDRMK